MGYPRGITFLKTVSLCMFYSTSYPRKFMSVPRSDFLYSDSTLLVLNGASLSCNNALLALNWRYLLSISFPCSSGLCFKIQRVIFSLGCKFLPITQKLISTFLEIICKYVYSCTCVWLKCVKSSDTKSNKCPYLQNIKRMSSPSRTE